MSCSVLFLLKREEPSNLDIEGWVGRNSWALSVQVVWLKGSKGGSSRMEASCCQMFAEGGQTLWELANSLGELLHTDFSKEIHLEENRLKRFGITWVFCISLKSSVLYLVFHYSASQILKPRARMQALWASINSPQFSSPLQKDKWYRGR